MVVRPGVGAAYGNVYRTVYVTILWPLAGTLIGNWMLRESSLSYCRSMR